MTTEQKNVVIHTKTPVPMVAGFKWSVGEMMEKFIKTLGDKKILGAKCPECGYVYAPPRWRCGKCFAKLAEENLTELSGKGTLISYTTAHVELDGAGNFNDLSEPKIMGAIKLEDADSTIYMPIDEVKPKDLKEGMKIEVVWNDKTEGLLTDIKYFKPV